MKYLLLVFRLFKKDAVQVWISISGLSIGLACFILSLYWYAFETGFDNFHKDYKKIYYVGAHSASGNFDWDATPGALAKSLSGYPGIVASTSFENFHTTIQCCYEQEMLKARYYGIDTCFFSVFTLDFVSGKPIASALSDEIIFTESYARKIFGDEPALGKIVKIQRGGVEKDLKVCGVIKDFPSNSNLKFDVLYHKDLRNDADWSWFAFFTFVKVEQKTNPNSIVRAYGKEAGWEEENSMQLIPIHKMHLDYKKAIPAMSRGMDGVKTGLSRDVIFLFGAANVLLMFAAFLNFILLQTTLLMNKGKEVLVRKLSGASRSDILGLFVFRLLAYTMVAFWMAVVLIECLLPYLINYVEILLIRSLLWKIIGVSFAIVLILVVLSALYPVYRLMGRGFQSGIKGNADAGKGYFRSSVVLVQLIIACFILFPSIIIRTQMGYTRNTDLGININNVYTLFLPQSLHYDYQSIMEDIRANPFVEVATNFNAIRAVIANSRMENLKLPNGENCSILEVNYDFQKLFDVRMKAGRFYSQELGDKGYNGDYLNMKGTSEVLVLNEKAAAMLEVIEPVGYNMDQFGTVIGVMNDYHSLSMRKKIPPMAFLLNWNKIERGAISMKVKPGYENQLNSFLENVIKKRDSSVVYTPPVSMKQTYLALYASETKVMLLLDMVSVLSLFISGLGIYSLALFAVKKRRKEVGVRKVLGSSIRQITGVLLKEYIILGLTANVLALPFAYYVSQYWLNGFAYHIPIQVKYYVMTFAIVLSIVLFVVSGQVWKVAKTNPIDVIKEND